MNRLIGGAVGLALGMAALAGPALAQETPPIVINADGPNVTDSGAGANSTRTAPRPSSSNDGGTVTLGDIDPGAGTVVIEAEPGPTTTNGRPSSGGGSSAPASGPDAAPESSGDGGSDRAVPTADDQDADNYPDASEAAAGLDPSNPDTDGDGAADGDEVNIYGTDPTVFDTDGDGLGDGEELFWTDTDPLVADAAASGQAAEPETRQAPASASDSDDAVIDGPLESTVLEEPSVVQGESAPPAASDSAPSCGDYADWYEAQTAFEASPSSLGALDLDGDGIVCESMMEA
jgi:hypothetical protein